MIDLKLVIIQYRSTGRVAIHYPRLKKISLNGFKPINENEALKEMIKTINSY